MRFGAAFGSLRRFRLLAESAQRCPKLPRVAQARRILCYAALGGILLPRAVAGSSRLTSGAAGWQQQQQLLGG
eukprot:2981975-Alexandrium_andersonii.AAC.1